VLHNVNIFYLFNNNLKYEITKQPLRASKYYKKKPYGKYINALPNKP
jgi:hypothetical protein